MPKLTVIDRSGNEHIYDADPGMTVMEIVRDAGIEEVFAVCGGCLSCATCHVHIDEKFISLLPSMAEDEDDILDGLDHRSTTSRLSCQIEFSEELDGMRVTVAEEE